MDRKTFRKATSYLACLAMVFILFSGCVTFQEDVQNGYGEISDSEFSSSLSSTSSYVFLERTKTALQIAEGLSENSFDRGEIKHQGGTNQKNESDLHEARSVSGISSVNNSGETIRIGAFNIQVFGVKKASNPEVMNILTEIIRTYDIVAIQEIRDSSQTALPKLVETVNSEGGSYSFVVSERLGRTSNKEQYAYLYDTTTVRLVDEPFTYSEPEGTDPFHREPYIASFEDLDETFGFILIVVHTDPDEATEEINSLPEVVDYARLACPKEEDFIIMGDLNADCSYFDEEKASSMSGEEYYWLIDNCIDTTTGTTDCTYDRIIITENTQSYFAGNAGVFRYDLAYNLTSEETGAVSDHYPVYAEFFACDDWK